MSSSKSKGKSIKKMNVEELTDKYQKLDQREHVLIRPHMYIGEPKPYEREEYIYDENLNKIIQKQIIYSDGLLKIFDEILSNATDQYTRLKNKKSQNPVTQIHVETDIKKGIISIKNNGESIEIRKHKKENIYIPELIFGNLLSGENFNDNDDRRGCGTNGTGSVLNNVFSKWFRVDIVNNGQRYIQKFENNLSIINPPQITQVDSDTKEYVKIEFLPDYERFDIQLLTDYEKTLKKQLSKKMITDQEYETKYKYMEKLLEQQFQIFYQRTLQTSATTDKDLKVFYNKKQVPVKDFKSYCQLFLDEDQFFTFESPNDDWQYGVAISKDGYQNISFVNQNFTKSGGTHVEYIFNQFIDDLFKNIERKAKSQSKGSEKLIKKSHIKDNIMIFVNASVSNPKFKSQSKEELTTKPADFKTSVKVSDKFKKSIINSPITEASMNRVLGVGLKQLEKTDGKKKSRLVGIPGLDDANWAGTAKSDLCSLILTEGLSAKTMAVSGVGALSNGRDIYGIFPLKGKVLNVKTASSQQIGANQEISYLKQIMGLQTGKTYTDVSELRYGKIICLVDQDLDGSHIKGLLMNLFQHLWPSLFQLKDFITTFLTPIVKVQQKNGETLEFYAIQQFHEWYQKNSKNAVRIKYFKGLGTHEPKTVKKYFSPENKKEVIYIYDGESSDNSINLAFNKKCIEQRKKWLMNYERDNILDYTNPYVLYEDFINKELIHFSNYDNERSLPSMVDGLKPSQRKVLYGCFKRNLTHDKQEIRVSQLAGYISEVAEYHHGEMSLNGTIVGMAQNFVGANNINTLMPVGQFGSRLVSSGSDAASARYIQTKLQKLTSIIYDKKDFPLFQYNKDDDGKPIEPLYYVPIVPMVLFTKTQGIGTGFSTNIPQFNPEEVVNALMTKIQNPELKSFPIKPWFMGFKGTVIKKVGLNQDSDNYSTQGCYQRISPDQILITELPIGNWTQDYKDYLQQYMVDNPKVLKDVTDQGNEKVVKITLTFHKGCLDRLLEKKDKFEKDFKLIGTGSQQSFSNSNMHLYDEFGKINKYKNVSEIINSFYDIRVHFYNLRKDYLVKQYEKELQILSDKARFILEIINKTLVVSNKPRKNIEAELEDSKRTGGAYIRVEGTYDHLLGMPIYTLTKEKVDELIKQRDEKQKQLNALKKKSPTDLWVDDLSQFMKCYEEYYQNYMDELEGKDNKVKKQIKKNVSKNSQVQTQTQTQTQKVQSNSNSKSKSKSQSQNQASTSS